MKLDNISFDKLETGKECLFRTDRQLVVHVTKVGPNSIVSRATGERSFTGQYHEVWQIDPEEARRA
jgi:hypothetical protein